MKLINKVEIILIYLLTIMSNILTGSPIKDNFAFLNILLLLLCFLYIIKNRKQIKFNIKTDIFILILFVTTIFPIIFETYYNYTDTLININNYFVLMITFFTLRDYTKNNPNTKFHIFNALIFSGVLIFIFGIDELTTKYQIKILNYIGLKEIVNPEARMISIFGYSNTFALYMGICTFICIIQSLHVKENFKTIYQGLAFIFISGIILSYSKAVVLILLLLVVLGFILLKDKKIRYEYFITFVSSSIFSAIYGKIFSSAISNKAYLILWGILLLLYLINFLIIEIFKRIYSNIEKYLSKKNIIIFFSISVLVLVILILLGINCKEDLILFNTENSVKIVKYELYGIEPNKEYKLEFDIIAETFFENMNNYEIEIWEENKYNDIIESHIYGIGNINGIKEININTTNKTTALSILFKNKNTNFSRRFVLKGFYINGKEKILNYKYLPFKIVNRIQSLNLNNKSVWERVIFIEDGIKLALKNPIFGIGGNGYKYALDEVKQYNYSPIQMHSFIVKIFIENGIFSAISFIIITIISLYYIIKQIKNSTSQEKSINSLILLIIILINAHSLIDFNLSFLSILFDLFIFYAIILSKEEKNTINKPITLVVIILIFIFVIVNIFRFITDNYIKYSENIDLNILNKFEIVLPNYSPILQEKYELITENDSSKEKIIKELLKNTPHEYNENRMLSLIKIKPSKENINLAYNYFNDISNRRTLNIMKIVNRNIEILQIAELIDEDEKYKFIDIILKYIDRDKNIILNYEDLRKSEEISKKYVKMLDDIEKEARLIMNNCEEAILENNNEN